LKLAIRLGLRAAHKEAFLDDLTVPDRVKPDLIEVHAFLALWRDLSLKANNELTGPLTGSLFDSRRRHHDCKSEPFHIGHALPLAAGFVRH
jgi:hypothetical protein